MMPFIDCLLCLFETATAASVIMVIRRTVVVNMLMIRIMIIIELLKIDLRHGSYHFNLALACIIFE